MVWRFFLFWTYFDLVKQVKFGVSRHFLGNPLRKWPEILHADVGWPLTELIRSWLQFADFFFILMLFWLSETGKICGFHAFWSCSVDFPHYGDPLAEIGHIWGHILGIIWRTYGSKCRGDGGGIFQMLCVEFCLVTISLIEFCFIMIFIMIVVTIIGIVRVIHYFLNYTLGFL